MSESEPPPPPPAVGGGDGGGGGGAGRGRRSNNSNSNRNNRRRGRGAGRGRGGTTTTAAAPPAATATAAAAAATSGTGNVAEVVPSEGDGRQEGQQQQEHEVEEDPKVRANKERRKRQKERRKAAKQQQQQQQVNGGETATPTVASTAVAAAAPAPTGRAEANVEEIAGRRKQKNQRKKQSRQRKPGATGTAAGGGGSGGGARDAAATAIQPVSLVRGASKASDAEGTGPPMCLICAADMEYYALGECNHAVCSRCALRMRVKMRDRQCPICKTVLDVMAVTKWTPQAPSRPFQSFGLFGDTSGAGIEVDDASGLAFVQCREHFRDMRTLRGWHCPICLEDGKKKKQSKRHQDANTTITANAAAGRNTTTITPFPNLDALHTHMQGEHRRRVCRLCLEHRPIFVQEAEVYTDNGLRQHERAVTGGHPLCRFCSLRCYDGAELFRHMRDRHRSCPLCPDTSQHRFYRNGAAIADHYRSSHFLCEHCIRVDGALDDESRQFRVFPTAEEYRSHVRTVHHIEQEAITVGFRLRPTDSTLEGADGPPAHASASSAAATGGEGGRGGGGHVPNYVDFDLMPAAGHGDGDDQDDVLAAAYAAAPPEEYEGQYPSAQVAAAAHAAQQRGGTVSDAARISASWARRTGPTAAPAPDLTRAGSSDFPGLPEPEESQKEDAARTQRRTRERLLEEQRERVRRELAEEEARQERARAEAAEQERQQRRAERNQQLADALGIGPSVGTAWGGMAGDSQQPVAPPGVGSGGDVAVFDAAGAAVYPAELLTWAKEHHREVIKVERRLKELVEDPKATSTYLKPMPRDDRRMMHMLAPYYALRSVSYDPEPNRYITMSKPRGGAAAQGGAVDHCSVPNPLLSRACVAFQQAGAAPPVPASPVNPVAMPAAAPNRSHRPRFAASAEAAETAEDPAMDEDQFVGEPSLAFSSVADGLSAEQQVGRLLDILPNLRVKDLDATSASTIMCKFFSFRDAASALRALESSGEPFKAVAAFDVKYYGRVAEQAAAAAQQAQEAVAEAQQRAQRLGSDWRSDNAVSAAAAPASAATGVVAVTGGDSWRNAPDSGVSRTTWATDSGAEGRHNGASWRRPSEDDADRTRRGSAGTDESGEDAYADVRATDLSGRTSLGTLLDQQRGSGGKKSQRSRKNEKKWGNSALGGNLQPRSLPLDPATQRRVEAERRKRRQLERERERHIADESAAGRGSGSGTGYVDRHKLEREQRERDARRNAFGALLDDDEDEESEEEASDVEEEVY